MAKKYYRKKIKEGDIVVLIEKIRIYREFMKTDTFTILSCSEDDNLFVLSLNSGKNIFSWTDSFQREEFILTKQKL